MKILLNLIFFLFGCTLCNAQFSEEKIESKYKKFFLGGSVNFSHSENSSPLVTINGSILVGNNTSENSTYSVNPIVGFQINENCILGADFLLNNTKSVFTDPSRTIENSGKSAGVFIRYILNPKNKFRVYASPYFRVTSLESSFMFNLQQSDITTEESNNLGISLGAQYEVTRWLRFTVNVGGLQHTTGTRLENNQNSFERETEFTSTSFNFRASSIFFGVEFLF